METDSRLSVRTAWPRRELTAVQLVRTGQCLRELLLLPLLQWLLLRVAMQLVRSGQRFRRLLLLLLLQWLLSRTAM